MTFHNGELAVQKQAGVQADAAKVGRIIQSSIPGAAADFIARQPLAFIGYRSDDGAVWASVLAGNPGQFVAKNQRTVTLNRSPADGDPLRQAWQNGRQVGLLFIEPATRRRMRVNGELRNVTENSADVKAIEVYSNCPKYIQAREWTSDGDSKDSQPAAIGSTLNEYQSQWISKADTFFIASVNASAGADVSHRGGNPGFVRIENDSKISFPDYSGNNMFNTLGNLALDPRAGLLFVDYATGATLQITGTASVSWDNEKISRFVGAERVVEFEIQQVIETPSAVPLRWRYLQASPFNPS